MEFLAMLYTVLLVAICLMMALLLFRSGRPTGGLDEADCEELKDWLQEQPGRPARVQLGSKSSWPLRPESSTPVRTPSPSRTTPPSAASARRCRRLCRA